MYCNVCASRYEQSDFIFCGECVKLLCHLCWKDHEHLKNGHRRNEINITDVGKLLRFFAVEESNKKSICKNRHDPDADYFCEICKEFTCHSCLSLYHQHYRAKKLEKYAPQIQNALSGCKNMLVCKGMELENIVSDLKKKKNETLREMKETEEMIRQSSQEILFRVAMALRKREKTLRKKHFSTFHHRMFSQSVKIENSQSFHQIFNKAKQVVTRIENERSIPLQKDLFTNLSALNRLDLSFLTESETKKFPEEKLPIMQKLSERKIREICDVLLNVEESKTSDVFSNKQDENSRTADIDMTPYPDAEDGFSIGETDEELGEFFVIGASGRMNRPTEEGEQMIRGPSFLRELHGTTQQQSKPKSNQTERDHVRKIGQTNKKSSYQEKYGKDKNNSLKSTSHSHLYESEINPQKQHQVAEGLKSQSTGSFFSIGHNISKKIHATEGHRANLYTKRHQHLKKSSKRPVNQTPLYSKDMMYNAWLPNMATRERFKSHGPNLMHHAVSNYHYDDRSEMASVMGYMTSFENKGRGIYRSAREQLLDNPHLKATHL